MKDIIHYYMLCSIPVQMKLGDKVIDTIEVPIQDIAAELLQETGHWMFKDGIMKG